MRLLRGAGASARKRHELRAQVGVRAEAALPRREVGLEAAQAELAAGNRLEVARDERQRMAGVAQAPERGRRLGVAGGARPPPPAGPGPARGAAPPRPP